jgi:putative methanogenesis marker protein 6
VLARTLHTLAADINVKETCFGCNAEAEPEVMRKVVAGVRRTYGNEVFTKRRGYPSGDPRRCRAQHGTRPGFSQLEAEWECLPLIQHALDELDAGNNEYSRPVRRKPLPVSDLKKICEESQ